MQTYDNTTSRPEKQVTAAIGFFDGVHLGHRCLINQVIEEAADTDSLPGIVTFPVHPAKVLGTHTCPKMLTTLDERLSLLKDSGIQVCILLPFTTELSLLNARDFMQMLIERYNVTTLIIGYDHRFGHNRSEGFDDYLSYGRELGIKVVRAREFTDSSTPDVGSTAIRRLLGEGDVKTAARLLGYYYPLRGTVVHGRGEGRKFGFPTANIQPDSEKLIPLNGVYAADVVIDETKLRGVLNIGTRPTLDNGSDRSIEVHIIGYDNNLYGKEITIQFLRRLRAEKKFNSLGELKAQIDRDTEEARKCLPLF